MFRLIRPFRRLAWRWKAFRAVGPDSIDGDVMTFLTAMERIGDRLTGDSAGERTDYFIRNYSELAGVPRTVEMDRYIAIMESVIEESDFRTRTVSLKELRNRLVRIANECGNDLLVNERGVPIRAGVAIYITIRYLERLDRMIERIKKSGLTQ